VRRLSRRRRATVALSLALAFATLLAAAALAVFSRASSGGGGSALESNPGLDPGTRLSRPAPDFTLTDQFGRRVSLRSFRGRAVLLAFIDSQCTTVCPLTTTAMLDAKALLGRAGAEVALLGVDANPAAIAVRDVRAYSAVHGMIGRWDFLTGSLAQLKRVWSAYGIGVEILRGQIDHTPALFAIDPQGRLRKVYLTQMVYASIAQQAQILARELASLLPGHPRVASRLSYAQIPPIAPGTPVSLPRAGGGSVRLGPSGSPRLLLFFATWDSETTNLGAWLERLNRYQAAAAADRLPALTAVDEASVEPSPAALGAFLAGLPRPLSYPVAIDSSGRVDAGQDVLPPRPAVRRRTHAGGRHADARVGDALPVRSSSAGGAVGAAGVELELAGVRDCGGHHPDRPDAGDDEARAALHAAARRRLLRLSEPRRSRVDAAPVRG
jgi:cytochrome oxidase Cu insertion factor (SCO1/SenC/PrrC family)